MNETFQSFQTINTNYSDKIIKWETSIPDVQKTVLVVGGAGFIGSVLTDKLLGLGHKVVVADNLFKPADSLLSHVNNPLFEFVLCDITNETQVEKLFQRKVDAVILLAGIVGLNQCDKNPALAHAVNVIGWRNVMMYRPEKIPTVAASTGSVYGEVLSGTCTEKTAPNPLSLYGRSKFEGEEYVTEFANEGVALRFATCAGVSPNMRLNLMPNQLTYEAITNRCISVFEPDNMRTFIDIRDFADALIYFMERFDSLKHRIYNVGTEACNLTKRQLAELIRSKTGCVVNYVETFKDADARNYEVSYERMHEAGFKIKHSASDMIESLVKAVPLLSLNAKYQ